MTQCPQPRFTVGEVVGGRTGGRSCTRPTPCAHVSYAVLGASLAPHVDWTVLAATALAFFLAVGLAARVCDEPEWPTAAHRDMADRMLWGVAVGALAGAVARRRGCRTPRSRPDSVHRRRRGTRARLQPRTVRWAAARRPRLRSRVGRLPCRRWLHRSAPPLTGGAVAALAAAAITAVALSYAQRCLSTPARIIRRRTRELTGVATLSDGTKHTLDRATLLVPLEKALRAMSWAVPLLAAALALARLSA